MKLIDSQEKSEKSIDKPEPISKPPKDSVKKESLGKSLGKSKKLQDKLWQ